MVGATTDEQNRQEGRKGEKGYRFVEFQEIPFICSQGRPNKSMVLWLAASTFEEKSVYPYVNRKWKLSQIPTGELEDDD